MALGKTNLIVLSVSGNYSPRDALHALSQSQVKNNNEKVRLNLLKYEDLGLMLSLGIKIAGHNP